MGGNLSLWAALRHSRFSAAGAILFRMFRRALPDRRYLLSQKTQGPLRACVALSLVISPIAGYRAKSFNERGGKYKPLRPALVQTSFLKMAFG